MPSAVKHSGRIAVTPDNLDLLAGWLRERTTSGKETLEPIEVRAPCTLTPDFTLRVFGINH